MSSLLRLGAFVCRTLAWAFVALVAANAVLPAGPRALLLGVNALASATVPGPVAGLFVFATPFGGAFRGDFAIVAIVLLVLDWLLCRISVPARRLAA
ncbi:MAG: hypothetical protein Q4B91_01405 [Atopobiaceae bacterium]|nr:hypothetical protein [Atopobiaceae bacterium]